MQTSLSCHSHRHQFWFRCHKHFWLVLLLVVWRIWLNVWYLFAVLHYLLWNTTLNFSVGNCLNCIYVNLVMVTVISESFLLATSFCGHVISLKLNLTSSFLCSLLGLIGICNYCSMILTTFPIDLLLLCYAIVIYVWHHPCLPLLWLILYTRHQTFSLLLWLFPCSITFNMLLNRSTIRMICYLQILLLNNILNWQSSFTSSILIMLFYLQR